MAAIGNGAAFRRGRDFVAWVDVVPRQYSTGGKQDFQGNLLPMHNESTLPPLLFRSELTMNVESGMVIIQAGLSFHEVTL